MSENKSMINVASAAKLAGYSAGHVRYLIRNGRIDAEKVGERVYLVDRDSLMEYVARMEVLGNKKFAKGR
jgi:excisionase family DNA binding protein